MGLDMYAYTTRAALGLPTDFDEPEDAKGFYGWRKHPALHAWMESLYRRKGGTADSFNCVPVALTTDDLAKLEADIHAERLADKDGFYFGEFDGTELTGDLVFIASARAAIAAGLTVFYAASW